MTKFDWGSIESFLAIARAGKLTTAAQKLGIEHSTLSRRIKNLEASLQARLFERSAKGYRLTPQGERLMVTAQEMETLAIQAEQNIAGSSSRIAGVVRIGATDGFGTSFLAPRLCTMSARHPELQLELVTMPRLFNLTKREADMAIGLRRPEKGQIYARKLVDYELGLYGSAEYLEKNGAPTKTSDLQDHKFVGYIPDLIYAEELNYLPLVSKGIEPQMTSSNLLAQLSMTQNNAGLCILPHFMASVHPNLQHVLADEILITRSFWLLVHSDIRDHARIRYCSDFLTEEVRANKHLFVRN